MHRGILQSTRLAAIRELKKLAVNRATIAIFLKDGQ